MGEAHKIAQSHQKTRTGSKVSLLSGDIPRKAGRLHIRDALSDMAPLPSLPAEEKLEKRYFYHLQPSFTRWDENYPGCPWCSLGSEKETPFSLAPTMICAYIVWNRNVLTPLYLGVFISINHESIYWASLPPRNGYTYTWAGTYKWAEATCHKTGTQVLWCWRVIAIWSRNYYMSISKHREPGLPSPAFLALILFCPYQLRDSLRMKNNLINRTLFFRLWFLSMSLITE